MMTHREYDLVKTLATKAGIFCELSHATGASHITHCGQKYIGIGVFQRGGTLQRDQQPVFDFIMDPERDTKLLAEAEQSLTRRAGDVDADIAPRIARRHLFRRRVMPKLMLPQ
ncbi:MAG: hypothetical protein A2535_10680 [Burkholderiales bacterium RIFOXYD2_FULL_59_8]|nr:MAG: hypothetical protein A2503_02650 [Burkholderiales bacterium RIFOXYD12_FULL_59_19]OGB81514.1 MAG: hypothetical protein A2496_15335 [Burkholderiales bacterium RIFOXYC12_FULL_60_6]OGB84302.1 MAG: hypothetical protein A2535_10680 [Burkholderiales bacterium RIFOXYD2_FULL_59_8]